jgi:two-component system, chemotaxis family, chemotaxis protein CheY
VVEKNGKTVLVVEDHLDTQLLMRQVLRNEGYEVAVAGNGVMAFEYLKTHTPPDLILLDLSLPEMTGDEFMLRLREQFLPSDLKVIVISGWDNLKERADAIGANGYIRKPFQLNEFYKQLESLLNGCSPSIPQAEI